MRKILAISVSVAATALVAVACSNKDDEFGSIGGTPYEAPPEDTSEPDPVTDTADTADTAELGEDSGDTGGPTVDSGDTAGTDATGTTEPLVGTGYAIGDTAFDLEANDQNDDLWSLHDQRGDVVVLVFGDYLDSTFNYIADYLDELASADVTVAAGLVLGADTVTADVGDAAAIAKTHGLETVLYLSNPKDQYNWATTRPTVYVLDRDMVIRQIGYGIVDKEDIEGWIAVLP